MKKNNTLKNIKKKFAVWRKNRLNGFSCDFKSAESPFLFHFCILFYLKINMKKIKEKETK